MTRTITRCIPCTGDAGIGIDKGLELAAANGPEAVARCYAKMVNRFADENADNYELVFPARRVNRGRGKYAKTARWEKPVGVYWDGLRRMHEYLDERIDPRSIGICLPFPPSKRALLPLAREWSHISIDDMGGRYKRLMRRLPTWEKDAALCSFTVETAATDTPSEPRKATRFVVFPGYENVVQRVRAGIVSHWVERWDTIGGSPLSFTFHDGRGMFVAWNNPDFPALSLYLPAADCETMSVETLARVAPLFSDISIQGPIPQAHMDVVRAWREVTNVEVINGR